MQAAELYVDLLPRLASGAVNDAVASASAGVLAEVEMVVDEANFQAQVADVVAEAERIAQVNGSLDIDTSGAERSVRNVADAADNVASSSSQAAGGIGDLAGAIELAGFPGLAGAMEVASVGIMGLTGAADLANLATEKLSISNLKSMASSAKDTIAKGVQTAATWATTTATTALGSAMTFALGPVGLIIIAVAALVAGLVIAYKNSETFRDIVNGVWESVKSTVLGVVTWFTDTAWPALKGVFDGIGKVVSWLWTNVIQVIFKAWVAYIQNILIPIVRFLWENVISPIFGFIGTLIQGTWENVIKPAFDGIGGAIEDIKGFFEDAQEKAGDFIDAIKDIKTPKWITDIGELISKVASGIGGMGKNLIDWFTGGDAPASFRGTRIGGAGGGGNTLARVQAAMPSGLRVTSTYRSKAQNLAVGGHPTSLHMDRGNPAVDIAGPVHLMDQFAAELRAMGGWRQLLWRVAGHYDHIHVAHNGGKVESSWGTVPGLRSDERPVITQTGERVLSRSQNRAYERGQGNGAVIQVTQNISRTVDMQAAMQEIELYANVARVR